MRMCERGRGARASSIHCRGRAEQEDLQAEARREHAAAISAVHAAVHDSRQEVSDLQKQAAHVAWRAERWELAGARRRNLQVGWLG